MNHALCLGCALLITFFNLPKINAQILFVQDCFQGGVLTSGVDNTGMGLDKQARIKWDNSFQVRSAYAVTYRYGRPEPHTMFVNGAPVKWSTGNQAGPEQIESNLASNFFAPHASQIENLIIENDTLVIDFPQQAFYDFAWNWGWWGIYVLVLYESPDLDEDICVNLYIADQNQMTAQNYNVVKPAYNDAKPIVFGFHSSRLSSSYSDATRLFVNENLVGEMWSPDLIISAQSLAGVHGHYAYDQEGVEGFNGDTANTTVHRHDGTAIINGYLDDEDYINFRFIRAFFVADGGANPHPSFNLAYTPTCPVISSGSMPRRYALCRGDTVVLEGIEGFDHYAWSPDLKLSDSMAMSPTCIPDSSRWYRLRMWNEDEADGCPLTIPVFVEVGDIPRPEELAVVHSSCPGSSGAIRFEGLQGLPPYQLQAGSQSQENPPFQNFTNLPPGTYPLSVVDDFGCSWDSTVVINLNTPHTAAFAATPTEGVSPLGVIFGNQSTGANGYQWLIDGAPFSTATNAGFTFPDSGSFEVSLVAYFDSPSCADTATVLIRVEPGIRVIMPNIFTPNGDGRNDELVAKVLGARSLHWDVFNRWGSHLHSGSTSPDPLTESDVVMWSPPQAPAHQGSSRPEGAMAEGTYVLVLTAEGITGKVDKMEFVVSLRR